MEYAERYSVPNPTSDTYVRYIGSLAVFVRWLLDHGYDVNLLLGDEDVSVIDELQATLREGIGQYAVERVTITRSALSPSCSHSSGRPTSWSPRGSTTS